MGSHAAVAPAFTRLTPETRYARSGDTHVAYQVVGDAPLDLVYVPSWVSQVEHLWEEPSVVRFIERISSFARVILFDRRGTGMSDPVVGAATLEDRMDDVRAVLDAVDSERAALFGYSDGGQMSALFAATYPTRTHSLILCNMPPRTLWAPDFPAGATPEERREYRATVMAGWGTGADADLIAPSVAADEGFRRWLGRLERLAAAPSSAQAIMAAVDEIDVRNVLPTIRVPTLVLHSRGDLMVPVEAGRWAAAAIPGARMVELPGADHMPTFAGSEVLLAAIEEFLTGSRHEPQRDRILATILFTDIVGSTERAVELGDERWRDVLERHDRVVRAELELFDGREIKTVGDGFLATFDGPARAIRCAQAIVEAVRPLGLQVRAGLHTGECERIGDDIGGVAVHIAARVAAQAAPNEVLASRTVTDLVAGSRLRFEQRREATLKGVPGRWQLFALVGG